MKRSLRRSKKAVSPVIATIIIVAVAIVMSIAVAYWMLGLAGTFTRFEKLEFVSAYAIKDDSKSHFNITIQLKNTGSSSATINIILFNGIPNRDVNALKGLYLNKTADNLRSLQGLKNFNSSSAIGYTLNPGEEAYGLIILKQYGKIGAANVTSGITIEIMVQTVAGNQYPKTIVLP